MSEKILIVDDDLDTLRLVGLMLQRQGYQISAATNGQQGLDKAFEEDPDLILLDNNPLENIKNTRSIHGVIKNGVWYDRATLDGFLKEARYQ